MRPGELAFGPPAVEPTRGERSEPGPCPPHRGDLTAPQWSPLVESGASPPPENHRGRRRPAAVESARKEQSEHRQRDPGRRDRGPAAVESACGGRSESCVGGWTTMGDPAAVGSARGERSELVRSTARFSSLPPPQWSPLAESGARPSRRRSTAPARPRRSGVRSRRAEREARSPCGWCAGPACRSGVRSRRAERGRRHRGDNRHREAAVESARGERSEPLRPPPPDNSRPSAAVESARGERSELR